MTIQEHVEAIQHEKKGKSAYTPLEKQFVEIKSENPDVLLLVEVGYKYRFFGDDAQIASRQLNIACFIDRHFYTASIPTHRLSVHVKKLVSAGYKVGVVRQTETAALKAASDNRNAPFTRKLTNIYTRATFIDILFPVALTSPSQSEGIEDISSLNQQYLMCIWERQNSSDEKAEIAIVAVEVATGDIIYDDFTDNLLRSELETRITHLAPCELLLPVSLTSASEKLIKYYAGANKYQVRIDRQPFQDYNAAVSFISNFYASRPTIEQSTLHTILSLPAGCISCITSLILHFETFSLSNIFDISINFHKFTSISHMTLPSSTLKNLEIFHNSTDGSEKGTLFSVLNHTVTSFGKRMLKKWMSKPLVREDELVARVEAVEEVKCRMEDGVLEIVRNEMAKMMDLEKALSRLHYLKLPPSSLYQLLSTFSTITRFIPSPSPSSSGLFSSPVLNSIFNGISDAGTLAEQYLHLMDKSKAMDNDKSSVFIETRKENEERCGDLINIKRKLSDLEMEMHRHLLDVRKEIRNSGVEFRTVSGISHLIELPHKHAIPKSWIKISATKSLARYHTPFVVAKLKEVEQSRERLEIEAGRIYDEFLNHISSTSYSSLRNSITNLAILDCLYSLAIVAKLPGYIKPEIVDGQSIELQESRHPVLECLVDDYVGNDIALNANGTRAVIMTGPNMSGKSSLIRQVALNVIMTQIGSYVPASKARMGIFDSVYTRMGASDNITRGQSTFFLELYETSEIISKSTSKSLVILDEIGRGTSTYDGTAIAFAVLKYFIDVKQCVTLFVTHYPQVGVVERTGKGKVKCCEQATAEGNDGKNKEKVITFLYKIVEGLADKSYGLNVAKLAGLPDNVIRRAEVKSQEMEDKSNSKRFVFFVFAFPSY
ncbi:muts domain V-domain-containing protein [Paraphysoderma sedebokerense]|nr:muts domain V-domain-containing protein [Paraphysoderma sedebokerense]